MRLDKLIGKYNWLLAVILAGCNATPSGFVKLQPFNSQFRNDTSVMYVTSDLKRVSEYPVAEYGYSVKQNDFEKMRNNPLFIDEIIADYKYIPLETSDRSLVGHIDELLSDGNRLFLVDYHNDKVLSFDKEGHFICQIGEKGKGHNEYVSLMNASLFRNSNEVCLLDWDAKKLLFYDYNGKYKRTVPMYFHYDAVTSVGDEILMLTLNYENGRIEGVKNSQITVCGDDFVPQAGILSSRGFPAWTDFSTNFSVRNLRALRSYPDGTFYSNILSPDTIWQYDGKRMCNFCSIDFGSDNIFTTSDTYSTMSTDQYYERVNKVNHIVDYDMTKDFMWIMTSHSGQIIINRKNGQTLYGMLSNREMEHSVILHMLFDLISSNTPFTFDWDGNSFVGFIEPYEMLRIKKNWQKRNDAISSYQKLPKKDRVILDTIDEEDNPVMLIVTLKPF